MISSSSSLHLHVRERSSSPCTWRICFDSLFLFVLSGCGLFSCRQAVGAKWLGGQQVHQWHTCTSHDTKFLECNLQEVHMTQDHVFVQGLSIQQGWKESKVKSQSVCPPIKRNTDERKRWQGTERQHKLFESEEYKHCRWKYLKMKYICIRICPFVFVLIVKYIYTLYLWVKICEIHTSTLKWGVEGSSHVEPSVPDGLRTHIRQTRKSAFWTLWPRKRRSSLPVFCEVRLVQVGRWLQVWTHPRARHSHSAHNRGPRAIRRDLPVLYKVWLVQIWWSLQTSAYWWKHWSWEGTLQILLQVRLVPIWCWLQVCTH